MLWELGDFDVTSFKAFAFDGIQPAARQVIIKMDGNDVAIDEGDARLYAGPLRDLTRTIVAPDLVHLIYPDLAPGGHVSVSRSDVEPATWQMLHNNRLRHGGYSRQGIGILGVSLLLLAALVGFFVKGIPLVTTGLAPLMPARVADRFGARIERSLTDNAAHALCEISPQHPITDVMTQLQIAADLPNPIKLRIIVSDEVNAFAVPGNRLILTTGLLSWVDSEAELISVLAHEVAHIQSHDPMALSLQTAASSGFIGFLLGDFAGTIVVASLGQGIASLGYSRALELDADRRAWELLSKLGIARQTYGLVLTRLAERGEGLIASHPHFADRLAAIQKTSSIVTGQQAGNDVKSPKSWSVEDWHRLRNFCH